MLIVGWVIRCESIDKANVGSECLIEKEDNGELEAKINSRQYDIIDIVIFEWISERKIGIEAA